jgi:cell division protein FtsB
MQWLGYGLLCVAGLVAFEYIAYRLFLRRYRLIALAQDMERVLKQNEELGYALNDLQAEIAAIRRGEMLPPQDRNRWLTRLDDAA